MRLPLVLAAIVVALSACGADPDASADTPETPSTGGEAVERAIRVFDVDGIEVVTATETSELPEQASLVEFAATVIDDGTGPVICTGAVMESHPPQCGGIGADGLDMDWAKRSGDVAWGSRLLTVRWPAVDNRTEVLDHRSGAGGIVEDPSTTLPEECAQIEQFPSSDQLYRHIATIPETNGGLYLADNGELVLQVTDDPGPHREAISGGTVEACVVQVAHTEADIIAIQDNMLLEPVTSSWPGPGGRLNVTVPVADAATAREIATNVDDPTMLRIIGETTILDG